MTTKHYVPTLVVAALCTLATVGTLAFGDIYNSTGFENPPFSAGPLIGSVCPPTCAQDGWVGVPPLSPAAAVVSSDLALLGRQSLRVRASDLVHQTFINEATHGYYHAIGSYRRSVDYDAGANGFPTVRVEAEVRIDGPLSVPRANFFSASVGAIARILDSAGNPASVDGVGELPLSSDGNVYGYCGCDLVPAFQASAPISLGTWHKLAIDVDLRQDLHLLCRRRTSRRSVLFSCRRQFQHSEARQPAGVRTSIRPDGESEVSIRGPLP
jgi:hypothetical protein